MARAIDAEYVEKIFEKWLDNIPDGEETPAIEACLNVVRNAPTLTPPNEWVSVENAVPDPGERVLATDGTFVGEAYRTSANTWYRHTGFPWRDCLQSIVTLWMPLPTVDKDNHVPAKAPNEPLTLEQLRGTPHGKIKDKTLQHICDRANELAYAYPASRIGREKWEPCDACSNAKHIVGLALALMDDGSDHRIDTKMNCEYSFCPNCGRPLTDEAWAELERRVCGEV